MLGAGSFKSNGFGGFYFSGAVNGVHLLMTVQPINRKEYSFGVIGSDANLTGTANPVTVELVIGENSGSAAITAAMLP